MLDEGWATADRTRGARTRAAEWMAPAVGSFAAGLALAAPDERRRRGIPAVGGVLQVRDDFGHGLGVLAVQGAVLEDALHGLGHVQPRAAQRREQRHDPMGKEPQDQLTGSVADQVVEDEEQAEGREMRAQRVLDPQARLPALPRGTVLGFRQFRGWWQLLQHGLKFGLQPGMEHRIGARGDALDPHLASGRMKEGQQFGGPAADVLMRPADRATLRLPGSTRVGQRLERAGLVLAPDRQLPPLARRVRRLDQRFFAVASGS